MRSTLFYIPHEILGVPLFGWGWGLGILVISFILWIGWQVSAKKEQAEIGRSIPVWLIAFAACVFVLPMVEQRWPGTDEPVGLPIRGYGMMVLAGLLCGVGITILRAAKIETRNDSRLDGDTIIGLGFWMMLGGVVGARLFYVIQKWDELPSSSLADKLAASLKLTEGGLVIYGGVIGGILACVAYCWRHRLHLWSVADLVAPGFLIGLALGRIGCLLHGCCFGGVCTADLPTIQFPSGSAPFASQIYSGRLLGLEFEPESSRVAEVLDSSLAYSNGLLAGDRVRSIQVFDVIPEPGGDPAATIPVAAEIELPQRKITLGPEQLPEWSLPVHPSQIYATINATLLCLLIWLCQPKMTRDGMAFCLAVSLYAFSRFLLEGVRSDEAGQFGTTFTISQWISMIGGGAALVGLLVLWRLPHKRLWHWASA